MFLSRLRPGGPLRASGGTPSMPSMVCPAARSSPRERRYPDAVRRRPGADDVLSARAEVPRRYGPCGPGCCGPLRASGGTRRYDPSQDRSLRPLRASGGAPSSMDGRVGMGPSSPRERRYPDPVRQAQGEGRVLSARAEVPRHPVCLGRRDRRPLRASRPRTRGILLTRGPRTGRARTFALHLRGASRVSAGRRSTARRSLRGSAAVRFRLPFAVRCGFAGQAPGRLAHAATGRGRR